MKRMTAIEKAHYPIVPELQAVSDYRLQITSDQEKINALTFLTENLKAEEDRARTAVYRNPCVEAFEQWVAARTKRDTTTNCWQELMYSVGHFTQKYTKDPEAGERVLLPALKVVRDRIAKEIKRLNDEEAARLAEAGLEPVENPSITSLRAYLSELANAIVSIPDWGASEQSAWQAFNHLIKV